MQEIMREHLPACGKNCNPENLSTGMNANNYTVLKNISVQIYYYV